MEKDIFEGKIKKEFIGDISMELYATNMFFRGNSPKEQVYDCCVHGSIVLRVGDKLLLDNAEGCVSASAYRFLHTLFKNHLVGEEEFLVPCCGHFMNPSEDKTSVTISGCSNGIDFNIVHEDGSIIIVTAENVEYRIPFENYKKAVISFAKQVMDFYMENPPREFEDDFDKDGYSAFVTEWYCLYDKAISMLYEDAPIKSITFKDYDAFTENEILGISKTGIALRSFGFINFKECAYNFKQTEGGSGKCVGERDITDFSFTFYTSPKPIMIKFVEKNKFIEFIAKENTKSRFNKLQKQILQYGYRTRDMS